MSFNFHFSSTLVITAFLLSCSATDKVSQETIEYASLDSGLLLQEVGEDGIAELVIPEMLEYTDIKEKIEKQNRLEKMELGSEELVTTGEDEAESIYSSSSILIQEEIEEEFSKGIETQTTFNLKSENTTPIAIKTGEYEEYIVQKRDSLMLISYRLYGDFSRWREIAMWNKDSLKKRRIRQGQRLRVFIRDGEGKMWKPSGDPYLVKRGDYLGLISKNVYNGKTKYWIDIWNNNKILIKDPNKIYAGFTIYTPTLESLLSKKKRGLSSRDE